MYDVYKIREQFPMLDGTKTMQGKPLVYLDNSSTTFKPRCVIEAINDYYMNSTANSHRGDYDLLYKMDQKVLATRKTVARFVNCEPSEVVFTSGDTMSLNLIAWGYAFKFLKEGDEIVLSVEEHASNLIPWFEIAHLTKAKVVFVSLDEEGKITIGNLEKVLNNRTKIVSLANVGNVLGYSFDVKEISDLVHKHDAILVIDGAQSVPHMKTDFKNWDIDLLTFSGHKLCGPTGIGCLVGKYHILDSMNPFLVGGGMNVDFDIETNTIPLNPPEKFEAGTQNLAGICGLKAAIEFIESIGIDNIHAHDVELNKYAVSRLKENKDIIIYNENANNGIVTFNIKGIFPEDESTLLNSKGIAIRSGQHCAKLLHHHIKLKGTCRMSTYLYTTKEEVDAFVDAVLSGGDILDAYFSN